jgi:hypothetical protein
MPNTWTENKSVIFSERHRGYTPRPQAGFSLPFVVVAFLAGVILGTVCAVITRDAMWCKALEAELPKAFQQVREQADKQ